MLIHQQRLAHKENILNRFVDIGVDLFAISCVKSYAESLVKRGRDREDISELADLFCRIARTRISIKFKEVSCNDDRLSGSLARNILAGSYEWLENDIIK